MQCLSLPGTWTIRIFFLIWNLTCLLVILHILLILELWSKTQQHSVSVDSFVTHLKMEKCSFLKMAPPGQPPGILLQASILISLCPGAWLVQFLRMHANSSVGLLKLILFLLREYFFWSNFIWACSHDLLLLFLFFFGFFFFFKDRKKPLIFHQNCFFFKFIFYWNTVDLHYFRSESKWFSFIYVYIHTHTYIYILRFFSIIGYYEILNIVFYAKQ